MSEEENIPGSDLCFECVRYKVDCIGADKDEKTEELTCFAPFEE